LEVTIITIPKNVKLFTAVLWLFGKKVWIGMPIPTHTRALQEMYGADGFTEAQESV